MKIRIFVCSVLFIFSLMYVFFNQKYTKRISIVNGYTKEFSVNKGEDVVAYLQPNIEHKKGVVLIYDLHGNSIDSVVGNFVFQDTLYKTKIFEKGYGYKNTIRYNTSKLKSGIYLIGNVVPFLVKDTAVKKAITVVFPYANIVALCNVGGKSFDPGNSSGNTPATKLSLERSWNINQYKNLFSSINWLDSIYKKESINFICDLDLENSRNISNTKLLVLNGYSSFWTAKQRTNFDKFQDLGGNVLAMCTNLINNKFYYQVNTKTLLFYTKNLPNNLLPKNEKTGLWSQSIQNIFSVGCSYEISSNKLATKSTLGGYKIANSTHPIFKNVGLKLIPLVTQNSNSIAVKSYNFIDYPIADNEKLKFDKNEILAWDYSSNNGEQTITGIFYFKKKPTSGNIIIIGSEAWCWDGSFDRKDISTITKNTIEYLCK